MKNNKPITLEELSKFYVDFIKPDFEEIKEDVVSKFKSLNEKMDKGFAEAKKERQEIKTELRYVKGDIEGLKAELSDTPSRKDLNQLKREVETLQTS